jgi:5-bromo-4-chloroindolyl phosphate hydrolysis protein
MLNMIGDSKQLDIQVLTEAVPCSYNQACDTLQDMIDEGLLGDKAYIDMSTGYLMLDGKGLGERKAKKKAEQPMQQSEVDEEMAVLAEIRRVNDNIPDPELSRKIDRIEEITRHILDYQKKHPEKAAELHNFLDYYLPTTLKILNSYAELDRQGVEGENISVTKERIEGMMDRIVEGFENQLDKLFEGDMLDISSDIAVMERMLSRDGLSGGMKMPKGPSLTLDPEGTQTKQKARSAPAAEPVPMAEPTPIPTPEPAPFTTPGGITLTLNPEGEEQSAPSWEDSFYRKTKEELEE